jgi:cation transport ATPase
MASLPTRRQAYAACLTAALAVVASTALLGAAVVAHPPLAVLPLLAVVCIGCPMAFGWSLPTAIAVLRATDGGRRAVRALRRNLAELPETSHPLGL